jgi:hypothetical protein
MTRRRKPLKRLTDRGLACALTNDEVLAVLHGQRVPLSTPEVAEYCRARYEHPVITLDRVRAILTFLLHRNRVRSWQGSRENAAILAGLGLDTAALPNRLRYWMTSPIEGSPQ